jgi:hypothetical protein
VNCYQFAFFIGKVFVVARVSGCSYGLSDPLLIAILLPKTLSVGASSLPLSPPPEPEVREPTTQNPLKSVGYMRTNHWGLFAELVGGLTRFSVRITQKEYEKACSSLRVHHATFIMVSGYRTTNN